MKSLEGQIRKHYEELTAAEKKLADVVLEFPGELTAYSASELAEKAGVSNAAASRFFKRLGFKSFNEARLMVRESKNWGSPLYLQSRNQSSSKLEKNFQLFRDEELFILQNTLDNLKLDEIDTICKQILRAKRLWVMGFRNSHFIAGFARWQFIQYRSNVVLLPSTGETLGEYIADFNSNDLVIVVGVRRRVSGLKALMATIHQHKASILYITDVTRDKTRMYADWVIECDVTGKFAFDSYTSIMSVIRLLAVTTYHKAGTKGREYLKRVEQEHEQLREFSKCRSKEELD